jgi:hypothetical protein
MYAEQHENILYFIEWQLLKWGRVVVNRVVGNGTRIYARFAA